MSSDDLQMLYQQVIIDHSRQRHCYGLQATADAQSHQLNPSCGDEITLQLHLEPTSGRVASVNWEGHGCVISTASASLLSDLVHDLTLPELAARVDYFREVMRAKGALEPDEKLLGDAVALQGVSHYVARIKCAMLAWVACEDAVNRLENTRQKNTGLENTGQEHSPPEPG
ncbi:MAG: Fe-S cluster assembly sulfur transfer protein SufU [Lacisediminihabitans sp.]